MPDNRLLAIITVLTCFSGAAGAQSAFSLNELRELEQLIVSRDCWALRVHLAVNPRFLEGPDPLAIELRNFVSDVDRGLIDCLSDAAPDASTASIIGETY